MYERLSVHPHVSTLAAGAFEALRVRHIQVHPVQTSQAVGTRSQDDARDAVYGRQNTMKAFLES